jgi:monoamine oxidase
VTSFAITNQDKVTVKTTGDTYTFDYVINTMPIGHLQRNLDTLFPTSLITPAKRAALMQFRMGTYTKVGAVCTGKPRLTQRGADLRAATI